jgi:hypothetical protein
MTRPSRREIERAIDDLQPPVSADERLGGELTDRLSHRKAYLRRRALATSTPV